MPVPWMATKVSRQTTYSMTAILCRAAKSHSVIRSEEIITSSEPKNILGKYEITEMGVRMSSASHSTTVYPLMREYTPRRIVKIVWLKM